MDEDKENIEQFPFEDKPVNAEKELEPAADPKGETTCKAREKPAPIALRGGVALPVSVEEQFRLAKAFCSSGMMPKQLNTPEKVLVALQLCHELGLPPMASIGKICIINQTASLWGELPLALARRSPKWDRIREEWLDEAGTVIEDPKGEVYGARCSVWEKGYNEPTVRSFTLDDARRARLTDKDCWKYYPKRMMQMRARSWALKDAFPEVLMGVNILEYDHNEAIETFRDVTPDVATELNQKFLPAINEEK